VYHNKRKESDAMFQIGCHVSIADHIAKSFERARSVGAEVFQIFTQNQRQWKAVRYSSEQSDEFRSVRQALGFIDKPLVSHASYLINLCAWEDEKLQRSRTAFIQELKRCDQLGLNYLVIHPGSYGENDETWGMETIADSLNHCLDEYVPRVKILLETTAGQGTNLGYKLDQLRYILTLVTHPQHFGICVDTCHVFAAGYDLASTQGWRDFLAQADDFFGLDHIPVWHLNDSLHPLGSRKDRHAPIGEGYLGADTFKRIVREARLQEAAGILEIPGGMEKFAENIAALKKWRIGD